MASARPNILLVDDDPLMVQILAAILRDVASLRFATSGATALRLARELPPDLILLDAEMPGMSGLEVCRTLKADDKLVHVPVVFVTGQTSPEFELASFDAGAADFIAKPFSAPLVVARVRTQLRVKQLTDELRHLAAIDPLTRVANRRSFDETLEREWRRGRRQSAHIALLMVDVDHFKLFNDRYGHPAGDDALRCVARVMQDVSQRPADLVARLGGEEFAVLLPDTTASGAEHLARSLVEAIQALALPHAASPTAPHLTVSVGVAHHAHQDALRQPADEGSGEWSRPLGPSDLVARADAALYSAKHGGRACVRVLELAEEGSLQREASASVRS